MASAPHHAGGGPRHRRPSTTASAHHPEQDVRQRRRRPWTRACAHRHAGGDPPHRRPWTRACAHHHEQDARHRRRRPWTRACAHHHAAGDPPHRRPWTTASAPHPEQDARHRHRRPSTTASAPHRAGGALRALPRAPLHDRCHAALEERPRIPARTEARRRHARAESATIRGPGPRAGCLDRMSRSLCSCRPRGPDDVCGVVGRTEVKVQANGCGRRPPRSESHGLSGLRQRQQPHRAAPAQAQQRGTQLHSERGSLVDLG
jgi:hypothetical protein